MRLLWTVPAVFLLIGSAFADTSLGSKDKDRHLHKAPAQGWVTTNDGVAFTTIQGQVAKKFFEEMPENSIVKDTNATCYPDAVVKRVGGLECGRFPPNKVTPTTYYTCEMTVVLTTGQLTPSDMCWE